MRLPDYQGFAIFCDPEGIWYCRKILDQPKTKESPWPFSEVGAAAESEGELKRKIDADEIEIPTS